MSTALRLTVAEYHDMIERGAFDGLGSKNIELIHGALTTMSPQGPWHADAIDFLVRWAFSHLTKQEVTIRIQEPVTFLDSDSEPEPDIVWARPQRYRHEHPDAENILLLIEVAHSTLAECLGARVALFAEAGVAEYWVVDLVHQSVHVFRKPINGEYTQRQEVTSGAVSSVAFPHVQLSLPELFTD